MEKQCKVTVKGTGQLNGPKIINKTVIMDSSMAKEFTGSKRYDVIEDFVRTHYPGVKINPKSFGANVVPIIEVSEKSKKKDDKKEITTRKREENNSNNYNVAPIILNNEQKLEDKRLQKIEDDKYRQEQEVFKQERLKEKAEKVRLEQIRLNKKLDFDLQQDKQEENRINKINTLIEFNCNNSIEDIEKHLDELLVSMSGFRLSKDKSNKNHYYDGMLSKYKLCLQKLKTISTNLDSLKFYVKQYTKLRNRRLLNKVISFIKSLDASNQQ
uniref:hypothetical protein n=1 Tax=Flavobacterium sp. TaxID=239 RepID=UPI00404A4BA0